MHTTTSPPPAFERLAVLMRSADAPAHEAIRLARATLVHTLSRGMIGTLAMGLSALAIGVLRSSPGEAVDVLALIAESLATVAPMTLVVVMWSAITTPRVMLATFALGLVTAGWVALGLVPLAAFTALASPSLSASRAGLAAMDAFALLLVITAIGSVVLVVHRVLVAIDPRPLTRFVARAFGIAAFGVFVVRAQPWFARLVEELHVW